MLLASNVHHFHVDFNVFAFAAPVLSSDSSRYEQAKAHRDAQMSQVCIMVDCISEARTINVTRTTSAQDCVKMLKAKLEDEQGA